MSASGNPHASFVLCLADAWLSTFLALLSGCALIGIVFAVRIVAIAWTHATPLVALDVLGGTIAFGSFALMIGFLPAVLVGAPLYGLLRYIGHDRYWTAGLLGLVIGLAVWGLWLSFEPFAAWLVFPPTLVALLTHRFSFFWRCQRPHAAVNRSESPAL